MEDSLHERQTAILIVGGGASGVLLAAHLLRRQSQHRVIIVERRNALGAGIAYGTGHPAHLLNVRAAGMSAYPDDADHFWRWIVEQPESIGPVPIDKQGFAPRQLYRHYLDSLLDPYRTKDPARSGLEIVRAEAIACEQVDGGIRIGLDNGRVLHAIQVVLATGNEGPSLPAAPWRRDGWSSNETPPQTDARVLIIGAGLTMVDQIQTLLYAGHQGPITALSRHALTPHPHRQATPLRLDLEDIRADGSLSAQLANLRARVRQAAGAGHDWRCVVDGLRAHTSALWQEWSYDLKLRFLRHARAFWDIHRHRIAPQAHAALAAAEASGQFRVHAGRIERFEETATGVVAIYRPRGATGLESIEADVVYECRGRASDITQTSNPLLRQLLDSGQVRSDVTGLGLDVTPECVVRSASGRPSRRLYAVGPLTSGVFWESTAVPDIRVQAALLATLLTDRERATWQVDEREPASDFNPA